jgi:putative ABC transport system permease protein
VRGIRAARVAFRLIILRDVLAQRVRTTTTIAGIALGIAVVLAMQLASAAALRGFEHGVESLAGRAALEVTQAPLGIDERRLPSLQWLQDYGQVTPIIEGEAIWTAPGSGGGGASSAGGAGGAGAPGSTGANASREVLKVLGIDILTDQAFRDYAFTLAMTGKAASGRPRTTRDLLSLLTDPDAVVLTEKFARAHGLAPGDTVRLTMGDAQHTLRVRALLGDQGPARALDGNLVVMDIAAAQVALGRLGYIDRLEIRIDDASRLDQVEATIAQKLAAAGDGNGAADGDVTLQRPARRGRQIEKMQAAFRSNLTALSTIALVAGMFLVYNTVSASVLNRRQEIGMLRAVGASRAGIFMLFLGEALVLALPGCALGALLGRLLAQGAVALTASTVSRMYVAGAAAPPSLDAWHVALAFLVGVPLALIAAAAPAHEAARIPPTDAIRRAAPVSPAARVLRAIVAAVSFGLAAWLCTFDAIDGLPLAGYLAAFFIVVGTTALTAPALLLAAAAATRLFRHVFILEAWLATNNLVEYARRMSVSVAALAVSLAVAVAIAVMVSSFRETVIYWVDQTLVADLYIGPAARRAGSIEATVPADIEAIVRAHPSVAAVDRFRVMDVPYQDSRIFVGAGNFEALLTRNRFLFKTPAHPLDAVRASIGQDAALVTEAFALRYRMHVGDRVTLPTASGPRAFRIAAIYYDYSSDRGTVVLDRAVFARYFGDKRPTGLNVYLKPDADVEATRRDLVRAFGTLDNAGGMSIFTNHALRAEVLRIFDGTFAITWALEVVAVAVAVMGIIATLITVIDERRRELAVLRLLGASRGQVQRMVVAEAAVLGGIGQALGLVAGFGLSLVLIYVVNVQSFGWSIQFHPPIVFLIQLTLVLVLATALAGLYPARRAARTYVAEHTDDE